MTNWLPQQPLTVKGDPASRQFLEYLQGLSGPTATAWGDITGTLADQTDLQTALNGKQATLVSGTNIKTVNGVSLLGAGNVSAGAATLLGAITTTSGSSQSLTSLDLTPYQFVRCVVNQVSFSGTGRLQIDGQQASQPTAGAANTLTGFLDIDLATGVFSSCVGQTSTDSSIRNNVTTYTTATTTITFSASLGTFDAGSIRVYGVP